MERFLLKAKINVPSIDQKLVLSYLANHPEYETNVTNVNVAEHIVRQLWIYRICNTCGKQDPPMHCSKCSLNFYCDEKCQLQDWNQHKLRCGNIDGPVESGHAALVFRDESKDTLWIRMNGKLLPFVEGTQTKRKEVDLWCQEKKNVLQFVSGHARFAEMKKDQQVTCFIYPNSHALWRAIKQCMLSRDEPDLVFLDVKTAQQQFPSSQVIATLQPGYFAIWIGIHVLFQESPTLDQFCVSSFPLLSAGIA